MPGRFIALEGADGVGKTTLARQLAGISYDVAVTAVTAHPPGSSRPAAGWPLVFASRRQISRTSPAAAGLMKHLATMLWESGDPPDLPDSFWVPVQAAWFTAHAETVLQPLLEAGYDVIVDGWVYKFCSKLLIQGFTQADLDVTFARVRMPDAVVLLTADIGALFDRRQQFRPAELGMHAGYGQLNRQTFVHYQQAGQRHLLTYARRYGWPVVPLDPARPAAESAAELAPLIASLRAAGTRTGT